MQIDFNIPVRGHYQNAAALLQAMRTAMPMYQRQTIRATRVTTAALSPTPMTLQVVHWISPVMIYLSKERRQTYDAL